MTTKTPILALFLLSVTIGCAATGDTDEPEMVQVQPAATTVSAESATESASEDGLDSDEPDAMRCKRIVEPGSRFKTNVCATNRQWESTERQAQEMTGKAQRSTELEGGSN